MVGRLFLIRRVSRFVIFACYVVVPILLCFRFSVRIFRNLLVGQECIFRCSAIELVSEICMVSRLDWEVDDKLTYILLFLEIKSTKRTVKLIYNVSSLQNSNWGRGIIVYNQVRVFRFMSLCIRSVLFLITARDKTNIFVVLKKQTTIQNYKIFWVTTLNSNWLLYIYIFIPEKLTEIYYTNYYIMILFWQGNK